MFVDYLDGKLTVFLHGHAVVRLLHNNVVELSNCGYRTATTKVAINNALKQLGFNQSVYQEKYTWYVSDSGNKINFQNGMVLYK